MRPGGYARPSACKVPRRVVGGLSLVGESRYGGRRPDPLQLVARTPSCTRAFDLAFDAKNSLTGSELRPRSASSGLVGFLGQFVRLRFAMSLAYAPGVRSTTVSRQNCEGLGRG